MRKEEETAINHCEDLRSTLEALEETLKQFETLKIEFLDEIQRKINHRAAILAFILPVFFLLLYLANDFVFFGSQIERSVLQTFVGTFIVSFSLWALGIFLNGFFLKMLGSDTLSIGPKTLAKQLFPKYQRKREELVQGLEELLETRVLRTTPIPAKYLNLKSLNYIIETLSKEEVSSLKEAVALLDLEVKNARVQHTLAGKESIFRAEEIIQGGMSPFLFEQWLKERVEVDL